MEISQYKDDPSLLIDIEKEDDKEILTLKELEYELKENPVSKFLVIKDNSKIIGYLDYWITFDSSTIFKIIIKKEYRKLGLASRLLEKMFEDLKNNEVLYSTLEVRESNFSAIKLYLKFGYQKISIKENYYKDGENAIYMVKGV